MIVNMLKNLSRRYSNHYIIKFVGYMPIYCAINMNIISSFMVFNDLYLGLLRTINLLQV